MGIARAGLYLSKEFTKNHTRTVGGEDEDKDKVEETIFFVDKLGLFNSQEIYCALA